MPQRELVETSDEDSLILVAQRVADLLNEGQNRTALADTPANLFLADCTNLVNEQRYAEYVARITSQVPGIFSKMSAAEAECVMAIVSHAVERITDDTQKVATASGLAQALTQADERCEERLNALLALYAAAGRPTIKLPVLLAAARYAAKNAPCRAAFCTAARGKASKWVADWSLSPEQARELYLALASAMRGATDRATTKEQLLLVQQAMATPGGDAVALAQHAAAAMADFIKSPNVFQLDVMDTPAAAAAARDPKTAPLAKLTAAMLAGDVAGARAASTPEALAAAGGVTVDAVLAKARMTALLAACATAGGQEVPLADLQKRLDLPADQVESWIVRAILSKLLDGKINQVSKTLNVARSTQPAWGSKEWAELRDRLARVKAQVEEARVAMEGIKPPQPVAARVAAAAVAVPTAAPAAAAAPARA